MIMREILILTDYKGIFGSKQFSPTYRGGMDVNLIVELFGERGYNVEIKNIFKIETDEISEKRPIVLYTSSEDKNGLYKSYIEDIIFHLEKCNYYVLPSYAYLRAHNNKVAMELIRERSKLECIKTVKSRYYGAIEELNEDIENITFPVVIKSSSGAMSRGVVKANNPEELIRKAKTISRSLNVKHDIKEMLRKLKYLSKYKIESFHRYKFIIQNFIEGLENDWKILVYGNKCFVLYRGNRKMIFVQAEAEYFYFIKYSGRDVGIRI
jgi:glutathione synthase/RimK-type ligase-like ATP-grasp enzyme